MASYIEYSQLCMCHDRKLIKAEVARLKNLVELDTSYMAWLLENDPDDKGCANMVRLRNKANKEMLESILEYYTKGQEDDPDG